MNRSKNTSFADRLSAAVEAKKAQLEQVPERGLRPRAPPPSSGERHGRRSGWLATGPVTAIQEGTH